MPYLCNVFFIVLDLRLTKVGVQRYSFFVPVCLAFPIDTMKNDNHTTFVA